MFAKLATIVLCSFALLASNYTSTIAREIANSTKPDCPLIKVKGDFLVRARYNSSIYCSPELIIYADGEYIYSSPNGTLVAGTLPKIEITRLKSRIDRLNFTEIESYPFTGTCPIAYDGVETIYTFPRGRTVKELSSCKYILDGKNQLFQQINRLANELQRANP